MNIDELLTALDRLDNDEDKAHYINSVMNDPKHPHHTAMPAGVWHPNVIFPSLDEIDEYKRISDLVWNQILQRFNRIPELLERKQWEYYDNLCRMREMSLTPDDVRKNMPLSNLPGYRGSSLYDLVKRAIPLWESSSITIESISAQRIGNGAYADVHLLTQPDGTKKVIKFFRPEYMVPLSERELRSERIVSIKENLMKNRRFFSEHETFANLRSIPYDFIFYVEDYAEGVPLKNLFNENNHRLGSGFIALSYLLETIHERDMIFIDVKPDSVIIDDEGKTKICDYDFCMQEDLANQNPNLYRTVKTPIYVPRETLDTSLPLTAISDLEQLAYILDHAYNKKPFISQDNLISLTEHAQLNRRNYPKIRQEALPKSLRDLVASMLNYPRDESITARDFTSALKEHYHN